MDVNVALRKALLVTTLCLAGCGGGGSPDGPGGRTPDFANARPWIADGPHAETLVACVDPTREPESCELGALPPLFTQPAAARVETIMTRLVVSHDWMGMRFEQILRELPPELHELFGGVTAIVIDEDIRPSFYWSLTGAIYLDPRHFWQTPEEEATIVVQDDFRSGFGLDLLFRPFSRYLRDGLPLTRASSSSRTTAELVPTVAGLLFHELAHANDFLPRDARASLPMEDRFRDVARDLEDERPSRRLEVEVPLRSERWLDLARILYFGEEPSDEERGLEAAAVGDAFAIDGANDPYAYSHRQEDLAMLFEETMMRHHLGLQREVAFLALRSADSRDCRDYVVGWARRDRIGADAVRARARFTLDMISPGSGAHATLDGLHSLEVTSGSDLCSPTTVATPLSQFGWATQTWR